MRGVAQAGDVSCHNQGPNREQHLQRSKPRLLIRPGSLIKIQGLPNKVGPDPWLDGRALRFLENEWDGWGRTYMCVCERGRDWRSHGKMTALSQDYYLIPDHCRS